MDIENNFFKSSWPVEYVFGYPTNNFEEAFKKKTMRYQENISREKLKQMLFETKNFDVYNIQSYLIQYIFSICEFKQGNFEFKYSQTSKNLILYSIREYLQKLNEEDFKKNDLQLISLVIIQLIAKIHELRPMNYEELSHLCSRSYSVDDFKIYEEKILKAFNFKFDFRHALLAEKLDIYFTYIIPLLNSKIIEKYKHITYVIQDLLNENFSQWFIYENKELMAASILQSSFIIMIQRKNSSFIITYRLMMISKKSELDILSCTKRILIFIFKLNEKEYENIFGFN